MDLMNREIKRHHAFKIGLACFVVPSIIGLSYIVKVFFTDGWYAFESNDEVAHTFIEIELAWKMLREGSLPLMNLFNNFGTPMIGDPVINPFALHSIPYLFLQAPVAATMNRFLIISLSISLLTFFYYKYFSLPLLISSISSILVVTLPIFNHFSFHHPHQGSILYFTLILIMQQRFKIEGNLRNLVGLYISLFIFAFGVGINAFFFALPFLIVNQYFVSDMRIGKHFVIFSLLLISLFIFFYPHYSSFFKWSSLSARASLNYAQLAPFTFTRLITDVIFFRLRFEMIHLNTGVYYSLPVIVFAILGLLKMNRKGELLRISTLGIVPYLIVMFLLSYGEIRSLITILKPVDVSRFLWFSNVFLAVSVGYALQKVKENAISNAFKVVLVVLLLFSLMTFKIVFVAGLIFVSIILVIAAALEKMRGQGLFPLKIYLNVFLRNNKKLPLFIATLALFFSFLDVHNYYAGYVSREYFAKFHPTEYLERIRPFSRVAVEFEPVAYPYFQLMARENIFGSNGRSIILHGGFKKYLLENNLITEGWHHMTYYFNSSNIDKLSSLGVKYVIASGPDGFLPIFWKKRNVLTPPYIASRDGQIRPAYLYENARDVDVGYLISDKGIKYLHDISYKGNSIYIRLPSIEKDASLVLAFISWPGWKVLVDGRPEQLMDSRDFLLRINVKPGNKSVVFYFEPFTKQQISIFIVSSIILFFITTIVFVRIFRQPDTKF